MWFSTQQPWFVLEFSKESLCIAYLHASGEWNRCKTEWICILTFIVCSWKGGARVLPTLRWLLAFSFIQMRLLRHASEAGEAYSCWTAGPISFAVRHIPSSTFLISAHSNGYVTVWRAFDQSLIDLSCHFDNIS